MLGSHSRTLRRSYQGALAMSQASRKREVNGLSDDEPLSTLDLVIPTRLTWVGPHYIGRHDAHRFVGALLQIKDGRLTSLPRGWDFLREDLWVHLRQNRHIIISIYKGDHVQFSTYALCLRDVQAALAINRGRELG